MPSVSRGAGSELDVPGLAPCCILAVNALLAATLPNDRAAVKYWRRTCREMVADARSAAYRAGYHAGRIAVIEDLKAVQQEIVRDLDTHLTRWDGLLRDFGKPRPGDYTGGPVAWDGGQRS